MVTMAPPAGRLAAVATPPWAATMVCTNARPRPISPRVSPRRNRSNTWGSIASSNPGPSSSTLSTPSRPSIELSSETFFDRRTELRTRLSTACRKRDRSASTTTATVPGAAVTFTSSARTDDATSSASRSRRSGARRGMAWPLSNRARSSNSFTPALARSAAARISAMERTYSSDDRGRAND